MKGSAVFSKLQNEKFPDDVFPEVQVSSSSEPRDVLVGLIDKFSPVDLDSKDILQGFDFDGFEDSDYGKALVQGEVLFGNADNIRFSREIGVAFCSRLFIEYLRRNDFITENMTSANRAALSVSLYNAEFNALASIINTDDNSAGWILAHLSYLMSGLELLEDSFSEYSSLHATLKTLSIKVEEICQIFDTHKAL